MMLPLRPFSLSFMGIGVMVSLIFIDHRLWAIPPEAGLSPTHWWHYLSGHGQDFLQAPWVWFKDLHNPLGLWSLWSQIDGNIITQYRCE
jgi:hypothetical protein